MDEIVIKGMAKWPDVPAVHGWLALDRRGQWRLKGQKIANPALVEFIGRNYEHDDRGRWFFQNGPQRVYVTLDYAPMVYRVARTADGALTVRSHHGRNARSVLGAWLDEEGAVLLQTDAGVGLVHDGDLHVVLGALVERDGARLDDDELAHRILGLQQGADADLLLDVGADAVPLRYIDSHRVPRHFGFDACRHPAGDDA